jgi:hypothetical protein
VPSYILENSNCNIFSNYVFIDKIGIIFEPINPGLDVTGNLVFEVPKDLVVTDTTLKFSGTGLFTKATIFGLK